jgi:radical SAM protein with 4Fe4S-binding SPASM domain
MTGRMRRARSLAGKAARRALGLPRGRDFFTYARNRAAFVLAGRRKDLVLPHPTSIMLEVTNLCQLRCVTCPREYAFGKAMDKGHVDLAAAKNLIDQCHIYLDSIGLTGLGETLLYPHLVELVEHIRRRSKGVHIFISTNAQQPDAAAIVDRIADKIDSLQISIDGCGEAFEGVRRNSNWERYLANVKEIARITRGRRARVKLNMVVLKANYHQMSDVVRLARSLGIPEVHFNTFNLVANDLDTSYYAFYHTADFRGALEEAARVADREGVVLGIDDVTSPRSFSRCPFPWNHFYVTWDGFLVPCCAKPFPKEKHFGNAFESSLRDCVNTLEFQQFREMSKRGVTPAFCARCHVVTGVSGTRY